MRRCFLLALCCFASLFFKPGPAFSQANGVSGDALGPNGVDAGDYVYVSAQGPRRADGTTPTKFVDQVRQSLDNVKKVVESAGLTMEHVVYVQVYLEDTTHYSELNEVFASYFSKEPPARGVLGVSHVPQPPVQITAVAVRNLSGKQPVSPLISRRTRPTRQGCSPMTVCSFPRCRAAIRQTAVSRRIRHYRLTLRLTG